MGGPTPLQSVFGRTPHHLVVLVAKEISNENSQENKVTQI